MNSRDFVNLRMATHFTRRHEGGTMSADRWNIKGSKWRMTVWYGGKLLGTQQFRRIRDGESWAIGLLRKARAAIRIYVLTSTIVIRICV